MNQNISINLYGYECVKDTSEHFVSLALPSSLSIAARFYTNGRLMEKELNSQNGSIAHVRGTITLTCEEPFRVKMGSEDAKEVDTRSTSTGKYECLIEEVLGDVIITETDSYGEIRKIKEGMVLESGDRFLLDDNYTFDRKTIEGKGSVAVI